MEEELLTTKDIEEVLVGNKYRLDCCHQSTPGHNFANTIIIILNGGGKLETLCNE